MKRFVQIGSLLVTGILLAAVAQAKVWRINNATGVAADFKEISTALASSSVINGDTLYVEGSSTPYGSHTFNKRLVVIGPGYLLSGTGSNSGLQAMGLTAKVPNMAIDSLASGSTFMGLSATFSINSNADDITITRCEGVIGQNTNFTNSKMVNLVINKFLGYVDFSAYQLENPQVTNCIFTNIFNLLKVTNGLIRNNVFTTSTTINGCYVSNNIFTSSLTIASSTVKYNIAVLANTLPAGNNNVNGVSQAALFVGTGSNDGKYMLAPGSPALLAGEPIGGVTPDAGAFGTADPYRLSGIPAIPSIYSLTVPASVPAASTTMDITFSTRSNN